ncbi:MAG: DUF72 domain-containing protein [Candidatus Eiseniibacteriota bacterium]
MNAPATPVVLGTSGFSFDDWVGPFYPAGTRKTDMLAHYAERFTAVEVNSTYYGIPPPRTMEQLDRKTPPGFEFVVKAHRTMTHEKAPPPPADFRAFHECLEPLKAAGKFRGTLLQFPWAFRPTLAARKRLELLHGELAEDGPLFVEFRHASWLRDEVFAFLMERGIGYCSVDEPELPGLVPAEARVTGETAYVRLHGRNKETWWGRGGGDRYDYDYSREELKEWVRKIRELAERSSKVYVFFNNCHAGQAARNALLMRDMLQQDLTAVVR